MSEFRDAIAAALAQPYCANAVSFYEASSVLAMPEMQAIRKALLHATYNAARHAYPAAPEPPMATYMRERCELPDSVIAWVLDEGSNP